MSTQENVPLDPLDGWHDARTEQHNIGHMGKLLRLLANELRGLDAASGPADWQDVGERVQYVAERIAVHVDGLNKALDAVEAASWQAEGLVSDMRAGAQ